MKKMKSKKYANCLELQKRKHVSLVLDLFIEKAKLKKKTRKKFGQA